jgi:hypothetical protein
MIRVILAFLVLSFAFGFVFSTLRSMTGKEKWQLTKLVACSIICSLMAIAAMVLFVVLF